MAQSLGSPTIPVPNTTRRYCPEGHIYQTQPEFVACCSKAQPSNDGKQHCPRKHEYTERNTLCYRGYRYCRTCRRDRRRRKQIANSYIKRRVRSFVRLRDDGRCRYCGEVGSEIDHVIARCNGGEESAFDNLVWSCKICNSTKGSEQGFTMRQEQLLWHGKLVSPLSIFGSTLRVAILAQRHARQRLQGLDFLVTREGDASL